LDIHALCEEEVEQLRIAYPSSRIELNVSGDCQGCWDGKRVRQMLGNLVVNAIHHGAPGGTVQVRVLGAETELRLDVSSSGSPIGVATLAQLFEPLKRGPEFHYK